MKQNRTFFGGGGGVSGYFVEILRLFYLRALLCMHM